MCFSSTFTLGSWPNRQNWKEAFKIYYEMNYITWQVCIFKIPKLGGNSLAKTSLHQDQSLCLTALLDLEGREKKKLRSLFPFFRKPSTVLPMTECGKETRALLPFFVHPCVQPQSPHRANVFVLCCLECYFIVLSVGKWRAICNLIITAAPPPPSIPLLCRSLQYSYGDCFHGSVRSVASRSPWCCIFSAALQAQLSRIP